MYYETKKLPNKFNICYILSIKLKMSVIFLDSLQLLYKHFKCLLRLLSALWNAVALSSSRLSAVFTLEYFHHISYCLFWVDSRAFHSPHSFHISQKIPQGWFFFLNIIFTVGNNYIQLGIPKILKQETKRCRNINTIKKWDTNL